jgi:hypothetical protein
MSPSPEHEDNKDILSHLVEILLEEADIEFRNLGSTTFKNEQMDQAVEPDACFYIAHEAQIRGKRRIDLMVDPPPDLAIEIDIPARTRFNNYETLGVPELWRYNGTTLEISVLREGQYARSEQSVHFPDLPLTDVIPAYLDVRSVNSLPVHVGATGRSPLQIRGYPLAQDIRNRHLEQSRTTGRTTLLRAFRRWVQQQMA